MEAELAALRSVAKKVRKGGAPARARNAVAAKKAAKQVREAPPAPPAAKQAAAAAGVHL